MPDNLKQKAITGILWKFLDQGGTQIIQLISGIYIARILTPEDFGLVGMLAIFLAISQVFIDSGFKIILIQKGKNVTRDDYNVVFYFNIVVSIIIYLVIFFSAISISKFYNEPRLILISKILGINLVIISLGLVQQIIFEMKLNFRTITKIRLVSLIFSVTAGILLSILGYGVWALVLMALTESFIKTTLLWFTNKWLPDFRFDLKVFHQLFSKSSKMLFAGILNQTSQNIFSLVIGKYYSTIDVGYYSQGKKLQYRILDFINGSIQNVMLPVQALIKDDTVRLKNSVRKNVKLTTLISFPAIIGFMVLAEPFIVIFLTEKWIFSVYYVQILSIAGIFVVLNSATGSYIISLGKINMIVGFTILYSATIIVIIAIGMSFNVGLKWLIIGKILQEIILFFIYIFYSRRIIGYKVIEVFADFLPALILSSAMGCIIFVIGNKFGVTLTVMIIQIIIGAGAYITLNYIFNRKLFTEVLVVLKSLLETKLK